MNIAFVLSESAFWGNILESPMVGGRELAALAVAERLAERHDVTVYAAIPQYTLRNNVMYHPLKPTDVHYGHEAVIAVEGYDVLRRCTAQQRIAWAQTGTPQFGRLDRAITHYVVNSPHKVQVLTEANPTIDPAKITIIGNGCDIAAMDACKAEPVHGRLLWTQSPDRGLFHLLRIWPRLKQRFPRLTLRVTYRAGALEPHRWSHRIEASWCRTIDEGQYLDGVTFLGALSRADLIREQKSAQLYACPYDPAQLSTETGNLGAIEIAAARVPMLLSDDVAVQELFFDSAWFLPLPVNDDDWYEGIEMLLTDPAKRLKHVAAARGIAEMREWHWVANAWGAMLEGAREKVTV